NYLPEQFIKGLTIASLQGRAQVVLDRACDVNSPSDLVYYMDGAHSREINVQEGGVVAQESVDVQKEGIIGQESIDIQEEGTVAPESVDVQE
nr:folylpolyglutamate synthase [Tanacetum cinerariifolium]